MTVARALGTNVFCPTGDNGGIDPTCGSASMTDVKVGDKVKFLEHVGNVVDFGKFEDIRAKFPDATIVAGQDVPESKMLGGRTWAVEFDDGVRLVGSNGMRLMLKRAPRSK